MTCAYTPTLQSRESVILSHIQDSRRILFLEEGLLQGQKLLHVTIAKTLAITEFCTNKSSTKNSKSTKMKSDNNECKKPNRLLLSCTVWVRCKWVKCGLCAGRRNKFEAFQERIPFKGKSSASLKSFAILPSQIHDWKTLTLWLLQAFNNHSKQLWTLRVCGYNNTILLTQAI